MKFHSQALSLAKDFKHVESKLMEILQKIDSTKEFRELGYGSLFEYVVQGLKLTEAQAYSLITVARKAKQVPELQMAVESGELSVSQARRIVPVINQQNAHEWIEKVQALPQKAIEKEVASLNPKQAVQERAKYVSRDRIKIELGVSEEFMKKLKRAQELMAQGNNSSPDMERAFEKMLDFYIQRQDPVEKAKRRQSKQASLSTDVNLKTFGEPALRQVKGASEPERRRTMHDQSDYQPKTTSQDDHSHHEDQHESNQSPIPTVTLNAIKLRDQAQCTFTHQKRRCTSRQWLHTHHIIPRSSGGTNHIANLTLLCATHHRYVHEELG